MTYRLALLSAVPLIRGEYCYRSLDLWVRDLEAQIGVVSELVLFAPVDAANGANVGHVAAVPAELLVAHLNRLDAAMLRRDLAGGDVVQLPGNFTLGKSAMARRFARVARKVGKPVIVGISSDRAKTSLMNAKGRGGIAVARAWLS